MRAIERSRPAAVPYATSLPEDLVERLRRAATEADVPQAAIIRKALRALLGDEREAEHERREEPPK